MRDFPLYSVLNSLDDRYDFSLYSNDFFSKFGGEDILSHVVRAISFDSTGFKGTKMCIVKKVAAEHQDFESDKVTYDLMMSLAQEHDDKKAIEELKKYTLNTSSDITTEYLMLRQKLVDKYGYGSYHVPMSKLEYLMPHFKAKEYTLKDNQR